MASITSEQDDDIALADNMRVLVTGGCGFIGSALVRDLISMTSAEILNVDKLTYAGNVQTVADCSNSPRYRFLKMDVCDISGLTKEIEAFAPDWIFHLAAESHVDRSIDDPSSFIHTNLVGTYVLLESARIYWERISDARKKRFRVVHVSTDEVFGTLELDAKPFTESSPYLPNSPYAATKAGSDHLARAWSQTFGLPVIISNCCNNFGPYQHPEKLIPTMILAALQGRSLPVYGNGENVRDWLYVKDHVRALLAIASRGVPGRAYLVGSNSELANLDLVRQLCRMLDQECPNSPHRPHEKLIEFVSDRPGHDLRYAIDSTRLRTELGWIPRQDFRSALQETICWYVTNRSWWEQMRLESSDNRRLGLKTSAFSAASVIK